MTREEAIHILDNLKPTNTKSSFDAYVVGKAITMAIKALEQEPCEDAISRQEVLYLVGDYDLSMGQVVKGIHALPSVTPQEPRIGHWIEHPLEAGPNWEFPRYECSECHDWAEDDSDYCPDCGAKMVEPQESEEEG